MSGKQEKKKRQQALVTQRPSTAPSYVRIMDHGDGQVAFEVDLSTIPLPMNSYSTDAVVVQVQASSKCTNVFFVGASATGTTPKSVVRVRFPDAALREQIRRDTDFLHRVDEYCKRSGLTEPWRPTLADIGALPHESTATFDGTFLTMAHWGEAAMCDIYRVPPDFAMRQKIGASWDIEPILRIGMTTNVLRQLLQEMADLDRERSE